MILEYTSLQAKWNRAVHQNITSFAVQILESFRYVNTYVYSRKRLNDYFIFAKNSVSNQYGQWQTLQPSVMPNNNPFGMRKQKHCKCTRAKGRTRLLQYCGCLKIGNYFQCWSLLNYTSSFQSHLSNFYLRKRIFWHFINTSYHTDRSKLSFLLLYIMR